MIVKRLLVDKASGTIKGKGSDEKGKYTIKGKVDEHGSLHFKKEYKKNHVVTYMGQLDSHTEKIVGTLEDFGQHGSFEISVRI